MALTNYSELLAGVANWLDRSDYTDRIPEFIALAEAEFNRALRTPDMETRANVTITAGVGPLPADSLGVRDVLYSDRKLEPVIYSQLVEYDQTLTGVPHFWAVNDGDIYLLPKPTGTAVAVYYQRIPALTVGAATNWLMTKAPDLYLFGCLMQAEFYGWNDDRLPTIKARVEEILEQLQLDGTKRKYGSTPLVPRFRHPSTLNSRIRA